jgi:GTP-binding protein
VADESADEVAAGLERGRLLFGQSCEFLVGAPTVGSLPAPTLPEVAFAGRSNVGKSSLINALTGRRSLARTSRTPGRTRQINVFSLGGRLMLVDLPGLGYAKAPEQMVAAWTRAIERYLYERSSLRRVYLLIDSRHGVKAPDEALMRLCTGAAMSFQAVLTKADKAKDIEVQRTALGAEIKANPAAYPEVAVVSAMTGAGIPELRAAAAALAEPRRLV